jgi:ketosteroid isomerase-like protein
MRYGMISAAFYMLLSAPCLAQDVSSFQAIQDRLASAILSGKGKAAAAVFADDAILLPPGEPSIAGRTAIESFWQKRASMLAELKLTTGTVQPMGDQYAREVGTIAGTTKSTPPQPFTGKYVIIFKKSGDAWLAVTDIWNRDK